MLREEFWHQYLTIITATLMIGLLVFFYASSKRDLRELVSTLDTPVMANYDTGLYDHDLLVTLRRNRSLPPWTTIHYTLDGNDPDSTSPTYHHALHLKTTSNDINVYPLKATLCYPDHQCAGTLLATYVLGDNLTRDVDLDIISLTANWSNLYDYDTGILVKGSTYDADPVAERGNYNQRGSDWIRPAQVTLITPDGTIAWQQAVGLAVSGDTSASYEVKSFKLTTGNSYGRQRLSYNFYPDPENQPSYPVWTSHKSLRLRSGAQDIFTGNIRSSVASRLLQATGYPGVSGTGRAVVYLNGHYYGIFEIQQNYSDDFIAARYSLPDKKHIVKTKGREELVWLDLDASELFSGDLNDPSVRAQLESRVDMDDYLQYYALHVLLNDVDWSHKNYEVWYWDGPSDPRNPYTDGRYRFLFYDADFIYSLSPIVIFGRENTVASHDTLVNLLEILPATQASSFAQVMTSQYYRARFLTLLSTWQVDAFATARITDIIDEEKTKIEHQESLHSYPGWEEDFYGGIAEMKAVATLLPAQISADVNRFWGLTDQYTLTITTDAHTSIHWLGKTLAPGETFTATYYVGTGPEISTINADTATWHINGQNIISETVTIDGTTAVDGELKISVSQK